MANIQLTIIEQIKLMRTITGFGLVESKVACECFARAQGLVQGNWITSMAELLNFTRFCGFLANGKLVVDTSKEQIFPALPKALTDQELYKLLDEF